jgi:hypothetical protein
MDKQIWQNSWEKLFKIFLLKVPWIRRVNAQKCKTYNNLTKIKSDKQPKDAELYTKGNEVE